MIENGKHTELHSDLERLKSDAFSLNLSLENEKERVIENLVKLEQEADKVQLAIEEAKPANKIKIISDSLAKSEAALAEQLKTYQNGQIEYSQLVEAIEKIEESIDGIHEIEEQIKQQRDAESTVQDPESSPISMKGVQANEDLAGIAEDVAYGNTEVRVVEEFNNDSKSEIDEF